MGCSLVSWSCDGLSVEHLAARRLQRSERRTSEETYTRWRHYRLSCVQVMGTLRDLQFALQLKIEELRQRDTLIDELELELDTKDELIRRLQGELDRYRASMSLPRPSAVAAANQKAKRKTIISEPFTLDPATLTTVSNRQFEKSQESQKRIQTAFSKSDLLQNLDEGEMKAVTACMYSKALDQGCCVIHEGSSGDQAYVLEEGRLDVTKDGQTLLTIEPENMFGEESLLYNYVHPYSVSAQTDSKLWVIDRRSYQTVLMQSALSRLSHSVELISSVPFLQSLPEDVIMKLSDFMEETHYCEGDYIIRQGATGDTFYIISKGQVKVTEKKPGHAEHFFLSKLSERQWFGEEALWGEEVRTVNVIAAGEVTCLVIDRETFRDIISGLGRDVQHRDESKVKSGIDPVLLSATAKSDFQVICTLGVGEFGHVDLVQLKNKVKSLFAMRVLKKKLILSNSQNELIQRERHILKETHCPFIVRLHRTFRDAKCLYMLTEACLGGDFCSLLKERGSFDDYSTRFYTACVVEALNFLHCRGVIYRDVKPEKVVLDERGYAKLMGSRCVKKVEVGKKTWTFCGTPGYMAPEIILNKGHSVSADFWSLGVFVFELLSGDLPFSGPDPMKILTATFRGIDHISFPKTISKSAASLIKKLCRSNPSQRLGIRRNGAKDIQKHKWFEGFNWDGLCKGASIPPIIPKFKHPLDSKTCDHDAEDPEDSPEHSTNWDNLDLQKEFGRTTRRKLRGLGFTQVMHVQEWLWSLCSSGGRRENLWSLLPSLPLSSFSLSSSSLLGIGAVASLTAYWLAQSVAVDGDTSCRRSALLQDDSLLEFYYDDTRTVYDMFQRGLKISGNGPCLGFRNPGEPYQWISYTEVAEQTQLLGSGLLAKGCQPNPQQFVGIFAKNRPEWTISELACYTYSMAVVPLYETLGVEAMIHIIHMAEISVVICDREEKAAALLENKEKGATPSLSCLVLFNDFSEAFVQRARSCGVEVLKLTELMDLGQQNLRDPLPPQPQDLAVVCFTSGTTGKPKGAMITHGNIASNTSSVIKILEGSFVIKQDDVSISYLPLAHMFERMIQVTMFCHGARVGFYQGEISLLMDDMKTLKPTFLPVVPRLLNRIYDKVLSSVTSPLRRALLHYAVRRKQAELNSGVVRNNSLWDKLVFNRIQASLGGNLRFALTASAPISPTVLSFLRATMGCLIFEGYGQTECTAGCTFSVPGDWTAGHVGAPLPCAMVKLVDIPEMNYFAKNGEGEICIRGPSVFKGYLKDPERTAEALDSDGWLHSGDVGLWLPNGTLRIIDRKKHIFKLSQGEYIAPEKIENVYMRSIPVLQVFVHGDSLESYLIGIVVPDPEVLVDWAKERSFVGSYKELCQNPDVKKVILEDMRAVGKEAGLKSFEQVKDIHLHPEMFSIANGLLTPTLKSRRADIHRVFQEQISNMYSKTAI
ncbi:hypothetical protein LDENG_00135990 [Lucifuga dentata]|nr:hypothetical protein LDENG_00135990 [Lucifuga dentata]